MITEKRLLELWEKRVSVMEYVSKNLLRTDISLNDEHELRELLNLAQLGLYTPIQVTVSTEKISPEFDKVFIENMKDILA